MNRLPEPPKWAIRFLEWYCRSEILEEIQGDLYELFDIRSRNIGVRAARRRFAWDVLRSFRLSTIRNINHPINMSLFQSNVRISLRHLLKQKMYSFVKIGGFAIGIAACILISLFIKDELAYEKHIPDGEHIYRVLVHYQEEDATGVHFPAPMAKALHEDYPEIIEVGRFLNSELFGAGAKELQRSDKLRNHYEEGFIYADQSLLDMFHVAFVYGDPQSALSQPNSIVISKKKADKYFPGEDPVGKTLILDNDTENPFTIGGVMEDLPSTSHFQCAFIMTMAGREFWPGEQNFWMANNYHTYIKLHEATDAEALEPHLRSINEKYYLPAGLAMGIADAKDYAENITFELQPLRDIHLYSQNIYDGLSHGDIRFVWIFGTVALFILLIACINFVNLSTARSANRAKEVGLRKVVGSLRKELVGQFLIESVLYSIIALALALVIAQLFLPFFNSLAEKSLIIPWTAWWFLPILNTATISVGIIAGLYPAFHLSSFKPIHALKSTIGGGNKGSRLQSALVVFQFATSIVLIIGTFVIYRQMGYILNKKLGFEKEQIVMLQGTNTLADQVYSFKQEILELPQVQSATVSDYLPINGTKRNGNGFYQAGRANTDKSTFGQIWRVDHDYIQTMGMNIIEGRDFSIDMPTDSQAVVINTTLAKDLDLKAPIVGKRITNGDQTWNVIGVIEDFHYESLKEDIRGLCMTIGRNASIVSVKIGTEDVSQLMADITQIWDRFSPNQSIRYTFLDTRFAAMYSNVMRMGRIFTAFAILAIIVACLGLFALSTFMAHQRSKEMSIRKILGAPTNNIFRLLTQSYLKLVLVSLGISVPIAWYLMNRWLEDYSYRTPITVDIFVFAGCIALLIAALTISFQTIKAALQNPIKALRHE